MSIDGVDEIRREMERNALRFQNGIKLAMGGQFVRVGPTPKRTVWSDGKVELWRYDTESASVRFDPPILLVPSVVSRSYVFDLHRGNSFVERLLEAGFAVYLVDWGIAGPEESGNTLETYIDELLPEVVAAACDDAGAESVTMLGYCFAGMLTLLYVAGHPDALVRNLITLAPPIDFSVTSGMTKLFAEGRLHPRTSSTRTATFPGTSYERRSRCASRHRISSHTRRSGTISGTTSTSRGIRRWPSSSASRCRFRVRSCGKSWTS